MPPGSSGRCLGTSREGPGGTRASPKGRKSSLGDARKANKSLFENISFIAIKPTIVRLECHWMARVCLQIAFCRLLFVWFVYVKHPMQTKKTKKTRRTIYKTIKTGTEWHSEHTLQWISLFSKIATGASRMIFLPNFEAKREPKGAIWDHRAPFLNNFSRKSNTDDQYNT